MRVVESLKSRDEAWELVVRALGLWAQFRLRSGTRGSGNRLHIGPRAVVRRLWADIDGDDNIIVIGPNARVNGARLKITGSGNRIVLDDGVAFVHHALLWMEGDGNELQIGAGSTIESATLAVLEGTSLQIGAECMIGGEVEVRTGDSHVIYDRDSGERINRSESIAIGERVWLGKRSLVLKGVELADGVVVGAAALVSRSIHEVDAVVAGNPARVVREGVRWSR